MKKNRNPEEVIDKLIEALGDKKEAAVESLRQLKVDNRYRAPEMQYRTWDDMQEILHDEVLADTPPEDFSDEQKACVRIFTDNPNIV